MRKEILFAIFAGILFGLVIAFGVWKANDSIKKEEPVATSTEEESTSDTLNEEFGLTIAKPENHRVFTESSVVISGITSGPSWIAISGENEDIIIQTNEDGSFEQNLNLISGVNEILINAYDDDENSAEEKLVLVYSEEFDQATTADEDNDDED